MARPPGSPIHRPVRLRVRLAAWVLWTLGGLALGVGGAWWMVQPARSAGASAGPWRANLLAGSTEADALTRARVALGGLLALNRSETMYFTAATDSSGRPLRSRCHYRISGVAPAARWWSLTAYADDFHLFADDRHRYSVNGANMATAAGAWAVRTGPEAPAAGTEPWLPTPGDRGLVLTLRVYNPDPRLQAAPTALAPPRIEPQGSCP